MYCQSCGTNVTDGASSCPFCGAAIMQQSSQPDVAQPRFQLNNSQSANQQSANQQSSYRQPAYQQSAYQQPAYQQPVYVTPTPAKKTKIGASPIVIGLLVIGFLLLAAMFVFSAAAKGEYELISLSNNGVELDEATLKNYGYSATLEIHGNNFVLDDDDERFEGEAHVTYNRVKLEADDGVINGKFNIIKKTITFERNGLKLVFRKK